MIKIKKQFTLLVICYTAIILCFSCKKDEKPYISPAVTRDELNNYGFIQIVKPIASKVAQYGNHEIVFYSYLENSKFMLHNIYTYSGFYSTSIIGHSYNEETGITTLKINPAIVELYKNKNGEIIINKFEKTPYVAGQEYDDFDISDVKLIKLNSGTYNNFMKFKQVSGNNYYGFDFDAKSWIYKSSAPQATETKNSTWKFEIWDNKYYWRGRDNGSAKYYNQFMLIPKGNGWNGEHKDKDLLLINTLELTASGIFKGTGPLGLYQLEE